MPNSSGLRILFGKNYKKWSWIPEQLSYTTPNYIAVKVAELAKNHYPNHLGKRHPMIWDMFSGLGSDSISFALQGFSLVCTEVDATIFELLKRNVAAFELNHSIKCIHGDCTKIEPDPFPDIIYFDPPWGSSFNDKSEFDFSDIILDNGLKVMDLFREIYEKKCKNIIIKEPLKCQTFENLDFLQIKGKYIFRKHNVKFLFL